MTALAMAPHGTIAGSASALLGSMQFVLGSAAGTLVGAASNGTAVPLAAVLAGCGVGAFAIYTLQRLSSSDCPTDARAARRRAPGSGLQASGLAVHGRGLVLPARMPSRCSPRPLATRVSNRLAWSLEPVVRRQVVHALCRYAISSVNVMGLIAVVAATTLVTNAGSTSNSRASTVVTTAVGIDACTMPA